MSVLSELTKGFISTVQAAGADAVRDLKERVGLALDDFKGEVLALLDEQAIATAALGYAPMKMALAGLPQAQKDAIAAAFAAHAVARLKKLIGRL